MGLADPATTFPGTDSTKLSTLGDYREKSTRYVAPTVEAASTIMLPQRPMLTLMMKIVVTLTALMNSSNPNMPRIKKVRKQTSTNLPITNFFKPTEEATCIPMRSKTPQPPKSNIKTATSYTRQHEHETKTNMTMATPTKKNNSTNKETDDSSAATATATNTTAATTQGKSTTNVNKVKPTFNPWKTAGPSTKTTTGANLIITPIPNDFPVQSRCRLHWWHTGDKKTAKQTYRTFLTDFLNQTATLDTTITVFKFFTVD